MNNFKQYFSIDDFRQIIESDFKRESFQLLHQSLHLFLSENKLLKPFLNHSSHRTNFGYHFEKYLNNTYEEYEKERVLEGIIDKFIFMRCQGDETKLEANYNNLIDKINSGNFTPFELTDDLYDFESGERFNMLIKNWEPALVVYIPGEKWTDRGRYELAKDEPIEKVVERQIEFKTGNLIVADWFKIQAFNELVDQNNKFDVNSEKGRIEQAKYYLDKFNFIHTTTWNSSDLYKNGDTYVFAQYNEDLKLPTAYKNKGHILKELRALSIIEKENLIELVGDEDKVNKYLNTYAHCIVQLKVKPGTYTFTLASAPEFIRKDFDKLDSSQTDENKQEISELLKNENFHPVLIMQGLTLKPTKKPKIR